MLMLNFLNEPALSPRRFQKGVYGAHLIRAPRPTSEAPASAKRARGRSGVLVVLLDVRYNKDPWGTPDGDFLGEAQWAWLERTLRGSRARAHLIVTGLQVLSAKGVGEGWARFPGARKRLLSLLHRLRVAAPILLSGDVHMAELNAARCTAPLPPRRISLGGQTSTERPPNTLAEAHSMPTPSLVVTSGLVELTASGMTHSWARGVMSEEAGGVSDTVFAWVMRLAQQTMPWRYLVAGSDGGRERGHGSGYYLGLNVGQVDFTWDAPGGPRVRLSVVGERGEEVLSRWWSLAELDLFGGEGEHDRSGQPDTREWKCWPLQSYMELVSTTEVAVGLGLCALKALGAVALVAIGALRAIAALKATLGSSRAAGSEPR